VTLDMLRLFALPLPIAAIVAIALRNSRYAAAAVRGRPISAAPIPIAGGVLAWVALALLPPGIPHSPIIDVFVLVANPLLTDGAILLGVVVECRRTMAAAAPEACERRPVLRSLTGVPVSPSSPRSALHSLS
jgi:hypothetical protein